ncbi:helix-turn-helix domain-containing protein [Maioricimonas sp. JC845]|uniref:helix-turn-helix transcriptional regulator n=1 Tax=Maioricimonas sp. JC845 TaxID=3232138 RepID=UPI003458083E
MSDTQSLTRTALPEKLPDWGVLVLESHHAPDFRMEWRTHSFVKVLYALSGSGDVLIRDQSYPWSARDLVVVPPRHRNRLVDAPGSATSVYVLCVATSLLQFDRTFVRQLRPGPVRRSAHLANQVESRLRHLLFEQSRANLQTPVSMVADALQLLALVASQPAPVKRLRDDNREPTFASELDAYLESLSANFFEATTIEAAAAQAGIPRRRFTGLFRERTGVTWLEYVHGLRIDHACRLLRETTTPIPSIAFECGFGDLSTFYRVFRRRCGVSPGRWREEGT